MATIDSVRDQIDARITELRTEIDQLERAAQALRGDDAPKRRRSASATSSKGRRQPRSTGKNRGRPRGSGQRAAQALDAVTKKPGITIPEIADKLGIKQNYLYRVMPTLANEGKVVKRDKGWHPVEA